ncbi:MAG: hypothetical protein RIT81_05080 [Deltaproteobacteria bacterium]
MSSKNAVAGGGLVAAIGAMLAGGLDDCARLAARSGDDVARFSTRSGDDVLRVGAGASDDLARLPVRASDDLVVTGAHADELVALTDDVGRAADSKATRIFDGASYASDLADFLDVEPTGDAAPPQHVTVVVRPSAPHEFERTFQRTPRGQEMAALNALGGQRVDQAMLRSLIRAASATSVSGLVVVAYAPRRAIVFPDGSTLAFSALDAIAKISGVRVAVVTIGEPDPGEAGAAYRDALSRLPQ